MLVRGGVGHRKYMIVNCKLFFESFAMGSAMAHANEMSVAFDRLTVGIDLTSLLYNWSDERYCP